MSEINTGGPAFPGPYMNDQGYMEVMVKQQGMTLRDYFAAKAMQGRVSGVGKIPSDVTWDVSLIAKQAYAIADAMLKAREK